MVPSDAVWVFQVFLLHLSVAVAESLLTKECMRSDICNRIYSDGVRCWDLCNGAKKNGVFVPLLVAPVAIITLMIERPSHPCSLLPVGVGMGACKF